MLRVNIHSFAYAEEPVLENINFEVEKGLHISILGESGCGKSTLLKAIYGLLQVTNGTIFWEDKKLLGPDYNLVPGEPFIKYLAQDFDLMPSKVLPQSTSCLLINSGFFRKYLTVL